MRGRPAHKTYLLARQGDLFPYPAYRAQLEKRYPYLSAMTVTVEASISARQALTPAGKGPARGREAAPAGPKPAGFPPATNRGGKSLDEETEQAPEVSLSL